MVKLSLNYLVLIISVAQYGSSVSLQGSSVVTYHDFGNKQTLQEKPLFCDIDPEEVYTYSFTAVENLEFNQCGTCLKIKNPSNNITQFIMALDKGGKGLNLSLQTYSKFGGVLYGMISVEWEVVNSLNCKTVVKHPRYLTGYEKYLKLNYFKPGT